MNILEKLYNGQINPVENVVPKDTKYRPLSSEIASERDYFLSKLPDRDKERFEKWNNAIYEHEKIAEYTNFTYGFKLGARLISEIFTEIGDQK